MAESAVDVSEVADEDAVTIEAADDVRDGVASDDVPDAGAGADLVSGDLSDDKKFVAEDGGGSSGCGCTVRSRGARGWGLWLVFVALALAAWRRRGV